MSSWNRLSGKVVYQNQWMSVHEDQVISPDGRASVYGWVGTPAAVFVVAVNEDSEVCLVQQERYITGRPSWEVPGGSTEGEDELAAAKKELSEEAGFHADHWDRLPGDIYPYNKFAPCRNIIYIATGLHKARTSVTATKNEITMVKWVGWPALKKMISTADITDGQTITALAVAGLALGRFK